MNKNINTSIIALAIVSILAGGAMLMSDSAYADNSDNQSNDKPNKESNDNGNDKSESENSTSTNSSSDDDYRGSASESETITICHVPKGNSGNRHTIHISFSAWPAHRDNHGGDYLGSCNNPPSTSTSTVDNFVVIKDCSGDYRNTLLNLTQTYFDPLIVNDDTRSDEGMTTALSKCLDRGDSSDSSKSGSDKGKKSSGQGGGHDSVSDSGHHHRISGCKNHDSNESKQSDSSKNFRKVLEAKNTNYNIAHSHGDSSINVSVKSLDDSAVKREYKKCTDSTHAEHKGKTEKGDSGHKYLELTHCANAQAIKAAIESNKVKEVTETKPIILKTSSLDDVSIKTAVDACLNPSQGGGTTSTVSSTGYSGRLNWREITNK